MFVTLSEVKQHLNILETETLDDTYLNHLIAVSENAVENYLNYSLSTYTIETLPKSIKHSLLLVIGDLFNNRESTSFAQGYKIPGTIDFLLNPIRTYNV